MKRIVEQARSHAENMKKQSGIYTETEAPISEADTKRQNQLLQNYVSSRRDKIDKKSRVKTDMQTEFLRETDRMVSSYSVMSLCGIIYFIILYININRILSWLLKLLLLE